MVSLSLYIIFFLVISIILWIFNIFKEKRRKREQEEQEEQEKKQQKENESIEQIKRLENRQQKLLQQQRLLQQRQEERQQQFQQQQERQQQLFLLQNAQLAQNRENIVNSLHITLEEEIIKLKRNGNYKMIEPTVEFYHKKIFKINNNGRDILTIDLHGLYVTYALIFLEDRINEIAKKKINRVLCVVCGCGNHSVKGIPRIRPKVIDYLQLNDLEYRMDSSGGSIYVFIDSI